MSKFVALAAVSVGSVQASLQHAGTDTALNPIRKVVTMLQAMQTKVQQEGVEEKELYEKFMCYCKTGSGDLDGSISAANTKIPAVGSEIESSEAKLAQAKQDLKQASAQRSDAKDAMRDATALRKKEAAAYASYKSDADANTAAIAKAVTALEKGMAGSFLQSPAAATLARAIEKAGVSEMDQQVLAAFLTQSTSYAPQSGEITGILKQMGDTMAANLADATSEEERSIENYKGLMGAKTKEVAATTSAVEAKTQQIGELGVALVQMKEDLSDTQGALAEDEKFLAGLQKSCSTKTSEWEERSKTRSEELVALADTIKVLNDDDALELFKKTLPGSSFVQMKYTSRATQSSALAAIRGALRSANKMDKPGLEMLALALTGKKAMGAGGFDKVVKMIDNMVELLGKEQQDDDSKKEYCAMQFDVTDDRKKALSRTIDQKSNAIDTATENIATLESEIASLTAGIKALDKSVAEATEQRKEENTEFKALMASDTAAKDVMNFAKNRLNKFYNPKLYKPAAKRELSSENRIYSNFGNADGLLTTPAPGGIADTGITAFVQISRHSADAAPAPPPSTWGAYASKSEEKSGVVAMIDLLIKDLDKEMTEAETDEKDGQADYEQMMKEAAAKRTTDSKTLTAKSAVKADTESELQARSEEKAATTGELMATLKYDASLHAECDWLLQYFDVRKQARADEVDSLKKAKAVLSGADYSLVQIRGQRFLGRVA